MNLISLASIIIILSSARAKTIFEEKSVIPDVLSEVPATLEVKYNGNAISSAASLSVSETSSAPNLSWTPEQGARYTVIMADPDAPSRSNPSQREWLHWLVVNIDGKDLTTGTVLSSYNGPTPPRGTGKHRYVIMVFEQENDVSATAPRSRGKFSTKKFAKDNSLAIVAANFFQTEVTE